MTIEDDDDDYVDDDVNLGRTHLLERAQCSCHGWLVFLQVFLLKPTWSPSDSGFLRSDKMAAINDMTE